MKRLLAEVVNTSGRPCVCNNVVDKFPLPWHFEICSPGHARLGANNGKGIGTLIPKEAAERIVRAVNGQKA